MKKQAGRFGLVKPGHPSKVAPISLVYGVIEKKILGLAKNEAEALK